MTSQTQRPFAARLSLILGVATITAILLGPLLARFGVVAPLSGFLLFATALPLALLAVLLGTLGLYLTRPSTRRAGAASSAFAVVSGLLIVVIISAVGKSASGAPRIHDITTDLDDPPVFVVLAKAPENIGEDLTYPHGEENTEKNTVELHRLAYPHLTTSHLQKTPETTVALIEKIAMDLGWTLVATNGPTLSGGITTAISAPETSGGTTGTEVTAPSPPQVEATIEATAASGIFRFVDDIVIRVRGPMDPTDARSTVDMRSKSRDGQSDLGVNAERIRTLQSALQKAAQN